MTAMWRESKGKTRKSCDFPSTGRFVGDWRISHTRDFCCAIHWPNTSEHSFFKI